MKILAVFFIASFAILDEFYIITPLLAFGNISLLVILYLTFLHKKELLNQRYLLSHQDQNTQTSVINTYLIFIIYIFIVDLSRGEAVFALKNILLQLGGICCLPLFNYFYYKKKFDFLNWLYFFIIVQLIFILLQIIDIQVILTDLIPQNPLIGTYEKEQTYSAYKRDTGAGSSAIHLAWQAMIFLTVVIGNYIKNKNAKDLIFFLIAVVILLNTQTRAAIFSFIPIVTICYFFYVVQDKYIKKTMYLLTLVSITIFLFFSLEIDFEFYFPYVFKEINSGDTHRLFTNFYVALGVLQESPIFGIQRDMAWDIYDKYAGTNYDPYSNIIRGDTPTHHNQLFFFFRYYGLIGLTLLLILYFKVFKAIKLSKDKIMSFIVGSIFILDLFFSMTHNNKIFYPFLWIFLSLIYTPLKKN